MTKYLIAITLLITAFSCEEKESIITIVDIGHLDRDGIAKELSIVNKYSPSVVGLDFLLLVDSLHNDIDLVHELSITKNLVRCSRLYDKDDYDEPIEWDSLAAYHSKFQFGKSGFSNFSTTEDSAIVSELPMMQYYKGEVIFAFSYLVAKAYNEQVITNKYEDNIDKEIIFPSSIISRNFKIISIEEIMTENFDKKDLTGKIVIMGHVSDKEDFFYLNENKTQKINGVEIHASFINALLN